MPITEHCVIGDQIRVPAAWCDMPGCQARFADPGALGEADNRHRALVAGWCTDMYGRLVCPPCQQRDGVAFPQRLPAHEPDAGGSLASAGSPPGPCAGASRYVRAIVAGWHAAAGPGRHRMAQGLHLLALLANDRNGWNTLPPLAMPSPGREPGRLAAPHSAMPRPGTQHRTGQPS